MIASMAPLFTNGSQDMDFILRISMILSFLDFKKYLELFLKCFLWLSLLDNKNPGTDFHPYWQSHLQSCYYVNYKASVTYSQASLRCTNVGGNLTSVLDQDQRDFLYGELNIMWQNPTWVENNRENPNDDSLTSV